MESVNDTVRDLLVSPFANLGVEEKYAVIVAGRPIHYTGMEAQIICKKSKVPGMLKFKKSWFDSYTWLCSCRELQKLFCWPCLLFSQRTKGWGKDGFSDFMNVNRALSSHKDTEDHLRCQLRLNSYDKDNKTPPGVSKENRRLVLARFNENVRQNRLFLRLLVDAALYLCKQELQFDSHYVSSISANGWSFKTLVSMLISKSPLELQNHYDKIKTVFSGDSVSVQNELISCISDCLQKHIKHEIKESKFFSVQVDTVDVCHQQHISIIVRFLNLEGKLLERFLGFHNVSADKSCEKVFELLGCVLKEFNCESRLVAQSYDGACVLPEHLNELQKIIKTKSPYAIFLHSLAHPLNLVLKQSCTAILECRKFFAIVNSIQTFFCKSAKAKLVIDSVCGKTMTTLVVQSSDSNLIRAISGIWDQLKRVFEVIINDSGSTEKDIMSSRGFLSEMNNIEFPFLAVVFNDIFTFTDFIFDFLQNKSLDITYCVEQLESASNVLKSRRDEFYLLALFDKAINLSGMTGVTRSSVRVLYFQVLDNILMQIDVRFKDYSKLQFISLVDPTQFIKYQRNFPVGAFDQLEKCYPNIFNRQRLKNELCLLYSLNESYKDFSLEEVLSALRENKDVFEESCKLFSLVLTLPSVSSSLERKFSFLQRFKKYSSNLRVSSLANIEFHKELLAELSEGGLFYDDVIDRIAVLEDGKIDLIYEQIENMVRNFKRKTERGLTPPDLLMTAVRFVHANNVSLRKTSKIFNISLKTLARYFKLITPAEVNDPNRTVPNVHVGFVKARQIFTEAEENELVQNVLQASGVNNAKDVRLLAYQFAAAKSKKMPSSWVENHMAGADWFYAFIRRHPEIPIRSQQRNSAPTDETDNKISAKKKSAAVSSPKDVVVTLHPSSKKTM